MECENSYKMYKIGQCCALDEDDFTGVRAEGKGQLADVQQRRCGFFAFFNVISIFYAIMKKWRCLHEDLAR